MCAGRPGYEATVASYPAVPAFFRLQEEKAVPLFYCKRKKVGTAGFEAKATVCSAVFSSGGPNPPLCGLPPSLIQVFHSTALHCTTLTVIVHMVCCGQCQACRSHRISFLENTLSEAIASSCVLLRACKQLFFLVIESLYLFCPFTSLVPRPMPFSVKQKSSPSCNRIKRALTS